MIMAHHTVSGLLLALYLFSIPAADASERARGGSRPRRLFTVNSSGITFQARGDSILPPRTMRFSFSDLEPGYSRDTRTPDDVFRDLIEQSARIRIPAQTWILHKWDEPPAMGFRRVLPPAPRPDDTSYLFWVGNVFASFEGLRTSISAGLYLTRLGMPFWGHDIGGYLVNGEQALMSAELFIRWTEYAALTPMMRLHGRYIPNDPWLYAEPIAAQTFRDYSLLHKNLRPYFISELARVAKDPGRSGIMTSLDTSPSYMLGASLLVSPVVHARRNTRAVTLPRGTWWDFWTDHKFEGPVELPEHPAPLEIIPFFVRGGSVIPMELDGSYSPMTVPTDSPRWALRFYPENGSASAVIFTPRRMDVHMKRMGENRSRITIMGVDRAMSLIIPDIDTPPTKVMRNGSLLPQTTTRQELSGVKSGWFHDALLRRVIIPVKPGPTITITIDYASLS